MKSPQGIRELSHTAVFLFPSFSFHISFPPIAPPPIVSNMKRTIFTATSPSLSPPPPPCATTPEDAPPSLPYNTHLVFVIHGMGQRYEKFLSNISQWHKNTQDILNMAEGEPVRMHMIPIEWHEQLHALDTVDPRIKTITLPTVPLMRLVNNDYLGDVVYYFTPFHG